MTGDLPAPPVPAECDLRGLQFMPLDVTRLLDSDIFAISTGDEFKAAIACWCKAWMQVPAGSLPDDDRVLAHLTGAGAKWKKVKAMALRGFVRCSDGRLYHPVVCEKALQAWRMRQRQRDRSARGNSARWGMPKGAPPPSPQDDDPPSHDDPRRDPRGDAGGDPSAIPDAIPTGIARDRDRDRDRDRKIPDSDPSESSLCSDSSESAAIAAFVAPQHEFAIDQDRAQTNSEMPEKSMDCLKVDIPGIETGASRKAVDAQLGLLATCIPDHGPALTTDHPGNVAGHPREGLPQTPAELSAAMWRAAKAWLATQGYDAKRAGALIGKWLKALGPPKAEAEATLLQVVAQAETNAHGDAIAYIEQALKTHRGKRDVQSDRPRNPFVAAILERRADEGN